MKNATSKLIGKKLMAEEYTPKKRMLNAYRGIFSDRYPVAPEFWYYFPAKILKLRMVEFEREVPFWQGLQQVFKRYECEGWGAAFPEVIRDSVKKSSRFIKIDNDNYREEINYSHNGNDFSTITAYNATEPSWKIKRLAEPDTLSAALDMLLCPQYELQLEEIKKAHRNVGEDYLLELWAGVPFFDFIADIIGFEQAVIYFYDEDEEILLEYRRRYLEYQLNWLGQCVSKTDYESYVIGCSYSCNSLLGARLWRKWDKPYIGTVASFLHDHGKLLHIHFHGKCMETIEDFVELGLDCVCPFERPPGGDVMGQEGLAEVRKRLNEKVTMNGNIHTVQTLIRGTPLDVRREIDELAAAFAGSARLIIGTGDQVGYETKDENIAEMIAYGKKQKVIETRVCGE
jgi:hypothetical protein